MIEENAGNLLPPWVASAGQPAWGAKTESAPGRGEKYELGPDTKWPLGAVAFAVPEAAGGLRAHLSQMSVDRRTTMERN